MAGDLLARMAANGIAARAAVADTAGAAWALARHLPSSSMEEGPGMVVQPQSRRAGAGGLRALPSFPHGHSGHTTTQPSSIEEEGFSRRIPRAAIVPSGAEARALAPLPVTALRLDETAAAQLPRLGLTRIDRILGLPRAQLTRRFGTGVVLRLDQALGRAGEALVYRRPPTPWFDRLAFAEPISALEDLVRVAGDIAGRLCERLRTEGRGARRFELVFHRVDGRAFPARAGLSLAGRDAKVLTRLFAPRLEAIDPGFGIEVVTLSADGVEPLSAAQGRLDAGRAALAEESVAALVDRLANRLGEDAVWRAEVFESHVPERAVRSAPAVSTPGPGGWDPEAPRPVRLFSRPEAVEAMAVLPDEPPMTFTWRGQRRRVVRAEGPERIAEEWWRKPIDAVGPAFVRDYYRVEDEAGGRFWLFRAGLWGDPDNPPRWWLHGVFA